MAERSELAVELAAARRAAAEAAALIARTPLDGVREKSPGDLVTAVDAAAERAIVESLRASFPGDAIVAEESASTAAASGRRWVVDPLDGTTNFVHGHPFVCVSIALVDDEGPRVGVVHAPVLGEIFTAARGQGAWLDDRPIRVSATEQPRAALIATGFPFKAGKGEPRAYMALVADLLGECRDVRRAGSAALDLAYVACGRMDAFFEPGLAAWDIAAGMLLVREAGGHVGGWPGDSAPPLETGRTLASNGRLHGWLENVLARHPTI